MCLSSDFRAPYKDLVEPILSRGAVDALVSCCPGLQELDILWAVEAEVQLTTLTRLSELTRLRVGGDVIDETSAEQTLAQITGLRDLVIEESEHLTDAGE